MTEDHDSAGEVVAATVRVALTAAGQLAEQAVRRREAALREAERDSTARVATLQAQLAAERQLAFASVQDVLRRGDTASVEEFARAWRQIASWDDPAVSADRDRLRRTARERFGVDPASLEGRGAPTLLTDAQRRDAATAAAVMATDASGREEQDRLPKSGVGDQVTSVTAQLQDAVMDAEVAQAYALSAQSHPTSPAAAARPPGAPPQARRRAGNRGAGVEVQSPGR